MVLWGVACVSCDPVLVEAARPLQPTGGPSYLPAKPATTTLERAPDVCAQREEGAPCKGQEGVFSDYSICHEHVCIESRCGDGVLDRRTGEFCDDGKNGDPGDGCTDTCLTACAADADCTDRSRCNGVEQCIDGVCTDGERVQCDDGDPRTVDLCSDDDGGCHSWNLDGY